MAVGSPDRRPPPPRFAGIALALLLPVGILAALSAAALARDWRTARAEAAARAQELALASVDRVARLLVPGTTESAEAARFLGDAEIDRLTLDPSNALIHPPGGGLAPHPRRPGPLHPAERRTPALGSGPRFHRCRDRSTALRELDALRSENPDLGSIHERPDAGPPTSGQPVAGPGGRPGPTRPDPGCPRRLGRTPGKTSPGGGDHGSGGIPVLQWAVLRRVELDPAFARRLAGPGDATRFPWLQALAESPPTPYLEQLLTLLRTLAPAPDAASRPDYGEIGVLAELERAERGRRHHAAAVRQWGLSEPWPELFWIRHDGAAWLAARQVGVPSGPPATGTTGKLGTLRVFALVAESRIRSELGVTARELDRRGDFAIQLTAAGQKSALAPGRSRGRRSSNT